MANKISANIGQLREAGELAKTLLQEMETQESPVEKYLMKAVGLARLLKDTDAQKWLGFEIRGYSSGVSISDFGTCEKYARAGGRLTKEDKYFVASLPKIEASVIAGKASVLNTSGLAEGISPVKNFIEARATEHLMNIQRNTINTVKSNYIKDTALLASLKFALHSYVSDCLSAVQLGDIAEDIFAESREQVEVFTRAHCPRAVEKFLSVNERMKENTPESRTLALTSCRRILMDIADSVFPAQSNNYQDSKGGVRKVDSENYKNRIMAFCDNYLASNSDSQILTGELDHLAARLDAVYRKNCKGVHVDVSRDEARLAVISTYLVIAEIARIKVKSSRNNVSVTEGGELNT